MSAPSGWPIVAFAVSAAALVGFAWPSSPAWTVFGYGALTAAATGLGAAPFMVLRTVSARTVARADALAAGLMLGAAFGLASEGTEQGIPETFVGVQLGILFVLATRRALRHRDTGIPDLAGADARRSALVLIVMTAHSSAEGLAVGASFAGEGALALVITGAIAFHNVPEGLAISAVLRPRGASVAACAGWSVFSSLPQPLLAVPAFLLVDSFRPALPWAFGFAAGAMVVLVFLELLPEAYRVEEPRRVAVLVAATSMIMLVVQDGLGH